MFKHCSCIFCINNANIADFYTQLSICSFQISCILQFSVISWHNLSETKSTSPEIIFDTTKKQPVYFCNKMFVEEWIMWDLLCVLHHSNKMNWFLRSQQARRLLLNCLTSFTALEMSNILQMQHSAKLPVNAAPFQSNSTFSYLFVSVWGSGFRFTSNVKPVWLWKRSEMSFLPWPSQTILAWKVTKTYKCFKLKGCTP